MWEKVQEKVVSAVVLWISINFSIFLLWLTKNFIVYCNGKKVNRQAFKLATYCYKNSSVLCPTLESCLSVYFSLDEFSFYLSTRGIVWYFYVLWNSDQLSFSGLLLWRRFLSGTQFFFLRPTLVSCWSVHFSHGEFPFYICRRGVVLYSLWLEITNYLLAYYCYKDTKTALLVKFYCPNS